MLPESSKKVSMLSVDWLVVCRHRPLSDRDTDSTQQQDDQRNPQTNRHHADDQRGQEVNRGRPGTHQQRPARRTRRSHQLCHYSWTEQLDSNRPAEEACAVVEWFSGQAEAHVKPKGFWVCVEGSNQPGRCSHFLSAQWLQLRVMTWRGIFQRWSSFSVCNRLPLNETGNIRGAVQCRNPS